MSDMKAYEGEYSYEGSFKHRKDGINELEVRDKFRTWEVYVIDRKN